MQTKAISIFAIAIILLSVLTILPFGIEKVNAETTTKTIYVDDSGGKNYTKIQDAIDNANDDDTIFVYAGTYYENIVIGQPINLIGENRDTTIIDGGKKERVVRIYSSRVNISGFSIKNGGDSYSSVYSYYNIYVNITGNNIYGSGYGIIFNDMEDSNIIGNYIYSIGGYGIYINYYSMNNVIKKNTISNCGDGIRVESYSTDNYILNNTISSSSETGILFDSSSSNNKIYNNNFISNKKYIDYGFDNSWNNITSGNYWSNYNGTDENGDGIGDTPFVIDSNSKDNFPVMKKIENGYKPPNLIVYSLSHSPNNPTTDDNISIYVNVADIDNDVSSVNVYYSINNGSWKNETMSLQGNSYMKNIGKFSSEDYIQYYVNATDNKGNFSKSITKNFLVIQNKPPAKITLNIPTEISKNSVKLSWTKNNDLDFKNYTIFISQDNQTWNFLISVSDKNTTSFTVSDLNLNTTYYFKIRVYDSHGLFNDSNIISAKTNAETPSKTIYVDDFDGKNYTKIQDAINNANNGDTVFVYAGTYYENIRIGKKINLIGENCYTTIIDGNGKNFVIEVNVAQVNISGFTIKNSKLISNEQYSAGIILWKDGSNVITNNIIFNNNIGILISSGSHYNRIENNDIYQNKDSGITLLSVANYNKIVNNTIKENNNGVYIYSRSYYNQINHNNFISNKNQATDYEGNSWSENYWSDYKGNDTNNDGIGDTSYHGDSSPLMNPNPNAGVKDLPPQSSDNKDNSLTSSNSILYIIIGVIIIIVVAILISFFFLRRNKLKSQQISQPQYPYMRQYQQPSQKQSKPRIVSCPNCSMQIQVSPMQTQIQCPRCGLKGSLGKQPIQQQPYQLIPQNIICPNCQSSFQVSSQIRPMNVQCPYCRLRGELK